MSSQGGAPPSSPRNGSSSARVTLPPSPYAAVRTSKSACRRDTSSPRWSSRRLSGGRVQVDRRGLQLLAQPLCPCLSGRARRRVDLPAVCLDRLGEDGGQRLADHGQHEHVRGERLTEARGELGGLRRARDAPVSRSTTIRRSARNAGVNSASSTGPIMSSSSLLGDSVLFDGDGEALVGHRRGSGSPVAPSGEVSSTSNRLRPRSDEGGITALDDEDGGGVPRLSARRSHRCVPEPSAVSLACSGPASSTPAPSNVAWSARSPVGAPTRGSRPGGRAPYRCRRRHRPLGAGNRRRSQLPSRPGTRCGARRYRAPAGPPEESCSTTTAAAGSRARRAGRSFAGGEVTDRPSCRGRGPRRGLCDRPGSRSDERLLGARPGSARLRPRRRRTRRGVRRPWREAYVGGDDAGPGSSSDREVLGVGEPADVVADDGSGLERGAATDARQVSTDSGRSKRSRSDAIIGTTRSSSSSSVTSGPGRPSHRRRRAGRRRLGRTVRHARRNGPGRSTNRGRRTSPSCG